MTTRTADTEDRRPRDRKRTRQAKAATLQRRAARNAKRAPARS